MQMARGTRITCTGKFNWGRRWYEGPMDNLGGFFDEGPNWGSAGDPAPMRYVFPNSCYLTS